MTWDREVKSTWFLWKKKKKSQKYLMKESKFSGIFGLCLDSKPNSYMQLQNQFSLMFQPRDIFFDILSMSFPHSHRWSLSARSWLPLLGSWKLKQKLVWQKNEDGLVHLILCLQKALIEMLYSALVCVLHCYWQWSARGTRVPRQGYSTQSWYLSLTSWLVSVIFLALCKKIQKSAKKTAPSV